MSAIVSQVTLVGRFPAYPRRGCREPVAHEFDQQFGRGNARQGGGSASPTLSEYLTTRHLAAMVTGRVRTDGFIDPCIPTLAAKPPFGAGLGSRDQARRLPADRAPGDQRRTTRKPSAPAKRSARKTIGARMHANEVQALTPLVVVAGSSGALQRERLLITGTLASVSSRCGCA
jgi:hypothetical protein